MKIRTDVGTKDRTRDHTIAVRIAATAIALRHAEHKAILARDVWLVKRARALRRGDHPNRSEGVAELELREAEQRRDVLATQLSALRRVHG